MVTQFSVKSSLLKPAPVGAWLPLSGLTVAVASVVTWGFLGSIPVTIQSQGIIVTPYKIRQLPYTANHIGTVESIHVSEGEQLERGDTIATINREEIKQQLEQRQRTLAMLEQQLETAINFRNSQSDLVQRTLEQSRNQLKGQREANESLKRHIEQRILEIRQQTERVVRQLAIERGRLEQLEREKETGERLVEKHPNENFDLDGYFDLAEALESLDRQIAASEEAILYLEEAKFELRNSELVTIQELESYSVNDGNFDLQLQESQISQLQLDQTNEETIASWNYQIDTVKQEIESLQLMLSQEATIVSPHSGVVTEILVSSGQVVSPGTRMVILQDDQRASGDELQTIAYFSIEDAKRIKPGMPVQTIPNTNPRERYGGISGEVTRRFSVPATIEGVINTVGSPELAESFLYHQPVLEVRASLDKDPSTVSGYNWTASKGPSLELEGGTTATVSVTVEQRRPISFVFPFVRSLLRS